MSIASVRRVGSFLHVDGGAGAAKAIRTDRIAYVDHDDAGVNFYDVTSNGGTVSVPAAHPAALFALVEKVLGREDD